MQQGSGDSPPKTKHAAKRRVESNMKRNNGSDCGTQLINDHIYLYVAFQMSMLHFHSAFSYRARTRLKLWMNWPWSKRIIEKLKRNQLKWRNRNLPYVAVTNILRLHCEIASRDDFQGRRPCSVRKSK